MGQFAITAVYDRRPGACEDDGVFFGGHKPPLQFKN